MTDEPQKNNICCFIAQQSRAMLSLSDVQKLKGKHVETAGTRHQSEDAELGPVQNLLL